VRLPLLEQDVSWMLRHQQVERAMMKPGLGLAVGLAHMLVLLSRTVAPEQQPKPRAKS
jgi:hypothetical protein